MPAFRSHTPDEIAHARTLYEETDLSPRDVARLLGLGVNTFYRRVKRWGWRRRRLRVEEVDAMALQAAASRDAELRELGEAVLDDRRSSADRAEAAVFAQIAALEAMQDRVLAAALTVRDGERAGRALQHLAKALVEVDRFRREQEDVARRAEEDAADEERARDALRRRIAALAAEEAPAPDRAGPGGLSVAEAGAASPEPPPGLMRRRLRGPRVIAL